MDDAERRAQIRQYWETTSGDQDVVHAIYHDDAVLEFPQSGERFEGVANFKEWRSQYPAGVKLEMRELRGQGDLWIGEGTISYDDGPPQAAVNILEFRGDKLARETIYVAEPFEAPEWRAQWRAAP
jgi:ketosteroid isomerase-like protein